MASRKRPLRRRRSFPTGRPIAIRVGSRRSPRRFHEVLIGGPKDAGRFARLVEDQVHAFPRDPLLISINGYQPWLEEILSSAIRDECWGDIQDLDREVQFAGTMQFPEKSDMQGQYAPWTFILDQVNVPQVYYWSVNMEPPPTDDYGLPLIYNFRFRMGVWQMGRGACLPDPNVSVTIIFTRPTEVSDHVVTELMFGFLYKDNNFLNPRQDEEGICWIFSRLYWLLTDWDNVITEIRNRLKEAEKNAHQSKLPVKMRARAMHKELDRIYELKEFLQFHSRAFKKLQKLKDDVPQQEQQDPVWDDMDDEVEDLDQFGETMDGLKERFSNLLDLEFNIQNAVQSDNSNFLSIFATIFLPVSFVASVFGISSVTWPAIWYLYVAIPVVVVSVIFTFAFPWTVNKIQKLRYPVTALHIPLAPQEFTMLGDELPDSANVPGSGSAGSGGAGGGGAGRMRKRSHSYQGRKENGRSRARSRSRD